MKNILVYQELRANHDSQGRMRRLAQVNIIDINNNGKHNEKVFIEDLFRGTLGAIGEHYNLDDYNVNYLGSLDITVKDYNFFIKSTYFKEN